MYQAKSGVKNFSLYWVGWGGPPGKVAQNELKQILVLEFLRSDDFRGEGGPLCEIQTYNRTHAIVTRQVAPLVETARLTKSNTISSN